jgi:transposase
MTSYAGLDVSQQETQVCVVAVGGTVLFEGRCATEPDAIARLLAEHAPDLERAVLETGALSGWLTTGLRALAIPAVCVCARMAHGVLKGLANKSDRSDAYMLAQMAQTGLMKAVHVRSPAAHERKALITARGRLVATRMAFTNAVRGHLKPFGIRLGKVKASAFDCRVRELAADHPTLLAALDALLTIRLRLIDEIELLDRNILTLTKNDTACRRLMTIPGVGALAAQTFTAVIDSPARFARSGDLGAYLGLVPRRWQSGETDYNGHITHAGDATLRHLLYECANNIIAILKRDCALKRWAMRLQERVGAKKARTALARKLAVLMHRLWIRGDTFDWNAGTATV